MRNTLVFSRCPCEEVPSAARSRAPPRRRRGGSSCNSVTISGKIRENARKNGSSDSNCKTIVKSSPAPLFSPPRSATAMRLWGNEHDLSTFRTIPPLFPVELGPELGPFIRSLVPFQRSLVPFQRNLVPKSNSMYRILILFPQKRPLRTAARRTSARLPASCRQVRF